MREISPFGNLTTPYKQDATCKGYAGPTPTRGWNDALIHGDLYTSLNSVVIEPWVQYRYIAIDEWQECKDLPRAGRNM